MIIAGSLASHMLGLRIPVTCDLGSHVRLYTTYSVSDRVRQDSVLKGGVRAPLRIPKILHF